MIHILLVCNAGMSSSMLVKKMKDAVKADSIEANIWAVGDMASADEVVKADIVCLGPQVEYLMEKMEVRVNHKKPVMIIDSTAYDTVDGKKVLMDAIDYLHSYLNS